MTRSAVVEGPTARSARIRVLVAAEDARVRTSLAHLLTSAAGLELTIARDADDAVALTPTVDVVVLDLAPGEASAGELLERVASVGSAVALGFDEADRAAASQRGARAYLSKTAAPDELISAVRRAAGARRGARDLVGTAALTSALFLGPWAFWGSRVAEAHGLIGWHLPMGAALWSIAPALLLAVALVSGGAGLARLGRRIVRWRAPAAVHLAAVGVPLLVGLASAGVVRATGNEVPFGQTLSLPTALVYFAYGTGLFLLTEEAGWRGVLLPRMQRRVGPTAAALVVGVLWAVWHLPLLAVPGERDHGLPVMPFLVLVVGTSVLMTGVVNAARGSVVVAAVFHASFDACYAYVGVVGAQHLMLWSAAAVTVLTAAALVVLTRGRLFRI